jgi:NADH-quinone oxidoreductase subunit M
MPNFAAIYMIVSLSSLGLPLLNGFIGEFTILRGTYEVSIKYTAWASIGIILGAAYLLWLYQRVMFGPVTNPANEHMKDLNAREYATLIPLVILCFWIGIYPKPLFRVLERPVQLIVEQVNPGYYRAERAAAPELNAAPAAGGINGAMPAMNMPGMNMPANQALDDAADPHTLGPNAKDNKAMPASPAYSAGTEKK